MDGMLSHLEELLEAKNIFVRNRKQKRTRAFQGFSCITMGFP